MSALSGEIAVPSLVIGQPSDIDVKHASVDDLKIHPRPTAREMPCHAAMLKNKQEGRCELAVLQLEGWRPISPAMSASKEQSQNFCVCSQLRLCTHWAQRYEPMSTDYFTTHV